MDRAQRQARNEAIIAAIKSGETYRAVAERHGLSIGGVQQVVRYASGPCRDAIDARRERNEAILDGIRTGRTYASVGEEHGLSVSGIQRVLQSMNEPLVSLRERRAAYIVQLAQQGLSAEEIAEETDASIRSVKEVLRDTQDFSVQALRESRKRRAVELAERHLDHESIASQTGLSVRAVKEALREAGIDPERVQIRERDAAIVAAAQAGRTFTDIGTEFGVSRERIRQIVARDADLSARALKPTRQAIRTERGLTRARQLLDEQPNMRISDVAAATSLTRPEVNALLSPRERAERLAVNDRTKEVDHDTIATHLREVAALRPGEPLASTFYDQHKPEGALSSVRLYQIYGTWRAAVERAGLTAPAARRTDYTKRWPEEAIWEAVTRFFEEMRAVGGKDSIDAYRDWCTGRDDAPSQATVTKALGSWRTIRLGVLDRIEQMDGRDDSDASEPNTGPAPA